MYKKKRMLLIVAVCLLAIPALAQEGRVIKAGSTALEGAVKSGVAHQIARQTLKDAVPVVYQAQIGNLAGAPIARVQLTEFVPVIPTEILQARVMGAEELHGVLHTSKLVYVPEPFATTNKEELYKGMALDSWKDLEYLLKDGLKMNKTRQKNGIFTTSRIPVGISYALPEPWSKGSLTVLVRIKPTDQFIEDNSPVHFKSDWVFFEDIPADMLPDVMVFLKVNGEAGWYKAQLEGGKIVLKSVPGINIPIK